MKYLVTLIIGLVVGFGVAKFEQPKTLISAATSPRQQVIATHDSAKVDALVKKYSH